MDKRIRCPHCGIATWSTDYTAFMRDHDRPDGKVCRKAQASYVACPQALDRIEAGMRIQMPNWDGTPGPTLLIVRVENEHVFTRSEVTGAVVVRLRRAVLLNAKEVR